MKTRFVFIIAFLMAACMPMISPVSTSTPETSYPTTTIQGDNPTVTPIPSTPSNYDIQSLIEMAKSDLAQRLSISSPQIDLVKVEDVVWPDSSLGCPQKGMAYAEVLTPGFLIILSVKNEEYEYHTSKGKEVIYCENPSPPVPGMPGDT